MLDEHQMYYAEHIFAHFLDYRENTVFIYGSRATGTNHDASDVDFGICGKEVSKTTLYDLEEAFDVSSFPYLVDIVDFTTANARFKKVALSKVIELDIPPKFNMKSQELFESLSRAVKRVYEAQKFPKTEVHMESTVQRFEYTFELSWKLMSSILRNNDIQVYGVGKVIRHAHMFGLIESPEDWLKYRDARNLTTHVYQEKIVRDIHAVAVGQFAESVSKLLEKAKAYIDPSQNII